MKQSLFHKILLTLVLGTVTSVGAFAAEQENNESNNHCEPKSYCRWEKPQCNPCECIDWCGPYAGIHLGYSWDVADDSCCNKGDLEGFVAGAHLGWNFNYCSVIWGAEADFDWSNIDGEGCCFKTELEWLGSIRARAALCWGRFLPYVTGGFAFGHTSPKVDGAIIKAIGVDSETHTGYVLGGGLDYWMSLNGCTCTSLRLEVLYYDLGDGDDFLKQDLEQLAVRVGLSAHF